MENREDGPRWLKAVLVLLLAWWTLNLAARPSSWLFLDFVNLAFHEAGHLIFRPLGYTVHLLGGTLGQLLVPLLLGASFLVREHRPFAAAVCLWWLGQSFTNVSVYMADARSLALPLVGGGDHDWNELFFRFGWLGEDAVARVSSLTRGTGLVLMVAGLAWAGQFLLPLPARNRMKMTLLTRWPWLSPLLGS